MSAKRNTNRMVMRATDPDQFLDINGVQFLWSQIKDTFAEKDEVGDVVKLMVIDAISNNTTSSGISTNGTGYNYYKASSFNRTPKEGENVFVLIVCSDGVVVNTAGVVGTYRESDNKYRVDLDGANARIFSAPSKSAFYALQDKVNEGLTGVYRFMGSVAAYANLPTENLNNGDVYNVEENNMNYAWVVPVNDEGEEQTGYWDPLGQVFNIQSIPNDVIQQIVDGTYDTESRR